MKTFVDRISDLKDVVGLKNTNDMSTFAKIGAAGAILAAMGTMPMVPAVAVGVASYSAYKITGKVLSTMFKSRNESVMRDTVKGLEPDMEKAVRDFADNSNDIVNTAIGNGKGLWLVRENSAKNMRVMTDDQFVDFQISLVGKHHYLHKAVVSDDKVTISCTLDGQMHGDTPEHPAMRVIKSNGTDTSTFAINGKIMDGPTPVQELRSSMINS